MFGLFKKKEVVEKKEEARVQRRVEVPEGSVFEYQGEFYDIVFAAIPDDTGRLQYGGSIHIFNSEYCWFFGNPAGDDAMFDDNGEFLPILSHANLEVVLDNIGQQLPAGFKLGSEIGIKIEQLKRLAGADLRG